MSHKYGLGAEFNDDKPNRKPKKPNNQINFNQVTQLIDAFNSNPRITKLSLGDFLIEGHNPDAVVNTQTIIQQKQEPQIIAQPTAPNSEESNFEKVKSPMVGTCYLAASPESENFVEIGKKVKAGDTICLIEAMKMFNKIKADVSGTIKKRNVEDGQPVEFDQVLFEIDTSGE